MPEISDKELADLKALADKAKTLEAEKAQREAEEAKEKERLEKERKEKEEKDKEGLDEKVKRERENAEKDKARTQELEKVLKFNLGVKTFVESNKDILPSDFPAILEAAEKEKYDTEGQKASAIRAAMVNAFFNVQANVDLLTENQKAELENFQKLTKNGREEKSGSVYLNVFEPALEMLKRVKKAEELGRGRAGLVTPDKAEEAYKQRLINHVSKKGEK